MLDVVDEGPPKRFSRWKPSCSNSQEVCNVPLNRVERHRWWSRREFNSACSKLSKLLQALLIGDIALEISRRAVLANHCKFMRRSAFDNLIDFFLLRHKPVS